MPTFDLVTVALLVVVVGLAVAAAVGPKRWRALFALLAGVATGVGVGREIESDDQAAELDVDRDQVDTPILNPSRRRDQERRDDHARIDSLPDDDLAAELERLEQRARDEFD